MPKTNQFKAHADSKVEGLGSAKTDGNENCIILIILVVDQLCNITFCN